MFRTGDRSWLACSLLLPVLLTGSGAGVAAQQASDASRYVFANAGQDQPIQPVLSRVVWIEAVNVPLDYALQRLVYAGAPLSYPMDLVRDVGPVSCRCAGVPLESALDQLTRGTGIGYREAETGGVLLFRRPVAEPERPAVGVVRGRVIDRETGGPLAGAAVQVVGTGEGALTDGGGRYLLLNVPAGTFWLKASRIGFEPDSQRVNVRDGATVEANFALGVDAVTVNPLEVTVSTGSVTATERKAVGNALVVISEEEIETTGAMSLPELLRGRAPGVSLSRNSGANGSGGHIQIRGTASILGDQTPLIYVDGVPVDAGSGALNGRGLHAFGSVNSNDASQLRIDELTLNQIERIEIIKGPAATTMYGTQGANGVIQIFTKRGAAGQTRITASVEQGVSMLDVEGFTEGIIEDVRDREAFLSQFREPRLQQYNVSLSGGSGDISYTLGAVHTRDDGYLPRNAERQTSVRTSFRIVPSERFSVHVAGNLVTRSFDSGVMAGIASDVEEALSAATVTETGVSRMYGSVALSYQPFPIWQNRLTVGIDQNEEINERVGERRNLGLVRDRKSRDFRRITGNLVSTLSYPRTGPITSTLSIGGEAFYDDVERFRLQGIGLPNSRTVDFDLAEELAGGDRYFPTDLSTKVAQVGGFVQEQLGFYDRLFLTAGLRVDGNSTFGDDYGLQVYPKLGASYVLQPTGWWDAKLRTAWGRSGKAPPPFVKDLSFELKRPAGSGTGFGVPTLVFLDPGNPDLRPEVGTEWEVGIENYVLGNLAALELNYFRQSTRDAHLRAPVPLSTGFQAGPLANIGELRSSGVELVTRVTPVHTSSTSLDVGFTLTHMFEDGLITRLGEDPVLTRYNQGFNYGVLEGLQEGVSVRDLYFTSIFPDTAHEGYDGRAFVVVGSRVPTTFGGLNLNLRFLDRLQLYANVIYNLGGHGFDATRFDLDRTFGYFRYSSNSFPPEYRDRYVFRTDQLRLDVLRLIYQVPATWVAGLAETAEFWVEGENLLSHDVYPRGDPEGVPVEANGVGITGFRGLVAPRPQAYKLGLRMTF